MDDAAKVFAEQLGPWAYVVIPAIGTMAAAFAGGCWYVSKSLVRGTTYYAAKVWALLEMAANKHFQFINDTSTALNTQTECLEKIKASSESSCDALSKMGSDPMKRMEEMRDEIVDKVMEAVELRGFKCEFKEAEKVVEAHMRKKQS